MPKFYVWATLVSKYEATDEDEAFDLMMDDIGVPDRSGILVHSGNAERDGMEIHKHEIIEEYSEHVKSVAL